MYKFILFLIITGIATGCNCQSKEKALVHSKALKTKDTIQLSNKSTITDSSIKKLSELKLASDSNKSYRDIKKSIQFIVEEIKHQHKPIPTDELSQLFKQNLLNRIIPFWEGTKWAFEGHTSQPKVGEIACGYFVSTTLKDVGLNLNRYKLAQQSPINEAKSLALNNEIIEIAKQTKEENIHAIDSALKEEIYFIGFDQGHVGYILKEKGQLYIIHSNYVELNGVEIEKIDESEAFGHYDRYYIVPISSNLELLKCWIKSEEIKIIKSD